MENVSLILKMFLNLDDLRLVTLINWILTKKSVRGDLIYPENDLGYVRETLVDGLFVYQ